MQTVEQLLGESPALASLPPEHRATIAGCARNRALRLRASRLLREGEPADEFFLIRRGRGRDRDARCRGAAPSRSRRSARARSSAGPGWSRRTATRSAHGRSTPCTSIALDGACLRGKCERDPALGFDLLKVVATVFVRAPRGDPDAAAGPLRGSAAMRADAARLLPGRGPPSGDPRRLDAAAGGGSTATPRRASPPASSRCSTCSARARCRSRSARSRSEAARSCTPCARSARSRGRSCAAQAGRRRRASAARSGAAGRSREAEGRDVVVVAGGLGLAPLRPVVHALIARARALRPRGAALRRPLARRAALPRRARGVAAGGGSTSS